VRALPSWFNARMLSECYQAQPTVLQRGKLNASFWKRVLRFLQQTDLVQDRYKLVPQFQLFAGGEWRQHKQRVQYRVRQQLDGLEVQLQEAERFMVPQVTAPQLDARDFAQVQELARQTKRIGDTGERLHDLSKKMEVAASGAQYKSLAVRFRAQQARLDKGCAALRRADAAEATFVVQLARILGELHRRRGESTVKKFMRDWRRKVPATETHAHWNKLRQGLLDQLHRPMSGGGRARQRKVVTRQRRYEERRN